MELIGWVGWLKNRFSERDVLLNNIFIMFDHLSYLKILKIIKNFVMIYFITE
jgi:hypothetical protein